MADKNIEVISAGTETVNTNTEIISSGTEIISTGKKPNLPGKDDFRPVRNDFKPECILSLPGKMKSPFRPVKIVRSSSIYCWQCCFPSR